MRPSSSAARLIAECAEPIDRIHDADLGPLLERIGDARVVLLGESTLGTSEFYRMRARITQELVMRRGFGVIAVDDDGADAAAIDRYLRDLPARPRAAPPFTGFPAWRWRNRETQQVIDWLRWYNHALAAPGAEIRGAGLDVYGTFAAATAIVGYLGRVDAVAAAAARDRYAQLASPPRGAELEPDVADRLREHEDVVVAMLRERLARRLDEAREDAADVVDDAHHVALLAGADRYYRALCDGAAPVWGLRDQHLFDSLEALLARQGPAGKVIVWQHNVHAGDASATELGAGGARSVGQRCRARFGDAAYLIGFGTDSGTVAAAPAWGAPVERVWMPPARADSYERLLHEARVPAALLALRDPARPALRDELIGPRLERAVGAVYRPGDELARDYLRASLPAQFDEYIWFEETSAVTALGGAGRALGPQHPFAAVGHA
ncbi:MAG TPA: erythromycin esterase family protein [Kofleriaceae bacterium]|nr:erythromycin esterase family protein [Kofleriaceae bacterium]